ncbi:DUF389 domain-containing protein [Desertimonas flava]|uniref:DUF389 domain-containing protein n=1 Tax=Desertimonas flava TaxID=2064846 RepID=UPI000E348DB9|nr:DUF389 domain-containing protein [Desertimonas flava]
MLHLRLVVPRDCWEEVVDRLGEHPGVVHLATDAGTSTKPDGLVVLCDVVREAGNDVIEWLQDRDIHRRGAITVVGVDTAISDAAAAAEAKSPGEAADAMIWESVESRVRNDSALSVSYVVFMAAAAVIAGIGIMLDSAILVIGAMVVGPDYGPLAGICVGVVRRRTKLLASSAVTAVAGFAAAVVCTLAVMGLLRLLGIGPDSYDLTERELTGFIAHPDALALVVALIAGIIGMLAITEARSGALIGVLVSVTTIPALGNAGLALAYGAWSEVGGALAQLAINVAGLTLAGSVTLAAQAHLTGSRS